MPTALDNGVRSPRKLLRAPVQKQIALLRILVGCGEKALEAFQAADNPLDTEFVTDLKLIIERSRDERAVLVEQTRAAD
jgi:membrane protein required for beta-lactamase induction